ncbi:MAG: sugar ABC transporter permease [Ruminococcus sp.]|nr:sugar ABC transporter permease [Ruminococcus sp.]
MQGQQRRIWHKKWIRISRNKRKQKTECGLWRRSQKKGKSGSGDLEKGKRSKRRRRESRDALLFLLPSLLGTGGFVLLPFLDVLRRSFLRAVGNQFVGWENYRQVLENEAFRLAAGNTARFMLVCLPLLLGISLGLAVLVRQAAWFQREMKTGFLLPMAIPAASMVVFFRMLFDQEGWLNQFLKLLGGDGKRWLTSSSAFWVLVTCYLWKNLGYDLILWLAGLGAVPEEQYEAARVQGAGEWQCFWYITLPQLKETAFVTGLLSFVNAFRVFREAYLLAGDYPHESIYMLQHLFNNWFVNLDMQKMTAAAVLLVLLTGGILGIEEGWRNSREKRERRVL